MLTLLWLAALAALAAPLTSPVAPQERGDWVAEVVMTTSTRLNGCAVGELDPGSPRHEIATVAADGGVYLTRQNGPSAWPWTSERIAEAAGELAGCAIGDADPRHAGSELLVFGKLAGPTTAPGAGAAFLLHRVVDDEEVWYDHELLLEDEAVILAGVVGDVDPDREGDEILLAGASKKVHLVTWTDGAWHAEVIAELSAPAASIAVHANGAMIGCEDGKLYQVLRNRDRWSRLLFDDWRVAQARVASFAGNVLSARDDGTLVWFPATGKRRDVYSSPARLRGAALGDLDPFNTGLEAVTADDEKRLLVLYEGATDWKPRFVHEESAGFRCVAIGELDPDSDGQEVVACGDSQRLIVAWLVD